MHICFITHEYPKTNYPHGGIGTFIQTFAKALVKRAHKVSVIGVNQYTNEDEVCNDEGVYVYRLRIKKIKGITWYLNYSAINKKIEVLHQENPIDIIETPELGLAFINKIPKIKYVIRLHGGHHFFAESEKREINWWKGFQEKRSFRKADAFIAVSKFVKSHTQKYLSYHNKPISIISNSIDLEVFKPKPDVEVKPKSVLFAGTICEKKGVAQLIKAMPKVLASFPETKLYMYGRDWYFKDGKSYIAYLKNEVIPELELKDDSMNFMGSLSLTELALKYAEAEVCVFPSLMETQGLVAPEAMAMEKTVVFTSLGPGPETIIDKETGLLCNPYDIDSISNNILWVFNNPKESSLIAKRAKKNVEDNYNLNTLVQKNIDFYKSLG